PVVAFTGAMDYWANVDAVSWFVSGVWPRLRAVHPHARFFIVGGKPAAAVQALARQPGVVVTGRVDDVRPYLKAADVAVAPMRVARGVQNKVLEAMAMGLPVVTTPAGLEGIDARAGEHLLVAADAGAFAQAVLDMLADAKRAAAIGQAARARAVARYGWTATLAPLARWLGESD
ncbi:MAG: glycosyltransferase, partial [Alphaproteobacteria bacterium]